MNEWKRNEQTNKSYKMQYSQKNALKISGVINTKCVPTGEMDRVRMYVIDCFTFTWSWHCMHWMLFVGYFFLLLFESHTFLLFLSCNAIDKHTLISHVPLIFILALVRRSAAINNKPITK